MHIRYRRVQSPGDLEHCLAGFLSRQGAGPMPPDSIAVGLVNGIDIEIEIIRDDS